MAPTLKKRKIIDSNVPKLSFKSAINSYGKISKSTTSVPFAKHLEAGRPPPALQLDSKYDGSVVQQGGSKKRRRGDDHDTPAKKSKTQSVLGKVETLVVTLKGQAKVQAKAPSNVSTPTTPVKRKEPLVPKSRKVETPTRGARAILEAFVISKPIEGEQVSPASKGKAPSASSEQIDDLTALHDAFLKTLALHFAHHGTTSPAEIRLLLPSIERAWGRRRIEANDLRRIVSLQQHHLNDEPHNLPITVTDYGHGKLCIEYEATTIAPLPVDTLRKTFSHNLRSLRDRDPNLVVAELPLAPVLPANPLDTTPRGPSKGAQRLLDLKNFPQGEPLSGLPMPPASSPASSEPATPTKPRPASRASALLDRIRAKEAYAAALPAPPSAEDAARRAALMRLPEVIPLINMLAGKRLRAVAVPSMSAADALAALMGVGSASGNGRSVSGASGASVTASFTMATVVQEIQYSLRNPIAREDVETCVRLAATEVVPGWITVTEIGKMVGVVVRGGLGRAEWMRRVQRLLGQE